MLLVCSVFILLSGGASVYVQSAFTAEELREDVVERSTSGDTDDAISAELDRSRFGRFAMSYGECSTPGLTAPPPSSGMSTSSIILSITWPYHSRCFYVIFLYACATLVVSQMCQFPVLSFNLSLRTSTSASTHLNCFLSFRCCQVSAPYKRACLTTVFHAVTFSFSGILLSHNSPVHRFPFLYAAHSV